MLTQCPSCRTTFRITSEILRVADGQVRCGRCQTQFDARQRLMEETDFGEMIHTGRFLDPASPPARPAPTAIDDPASREDVTLEGGHIEISGRHRVADTPQGEPQIREEVVEEWVEFDDLDATGPAHDPAEARQPFDELEEISDGEQPAGAPSDEQADALRLSEPDLEEDVDSDVEDGGIADARVADIRIDDAETEDATRDDSSTDDAIDEATAQYRLKKQIADLDAHLGDEYEPERQPLHAPRSSSQVAEPAVAQSDAAEELDLLPRRARRPVPLIWKILAVPLLLVLAAQFVHHHRATLARDPRIGPPLVGIYDALGLSIRPDWDLHAYEILQWHVASDPATPGTLRVRASIKNLADFAQPYPLLRLVLEDRWGEAVRAREFTPAEYLQADSAATALLAPAQLANANIAIVDPGPDAEGFRFDVCLNGLRGPVCAGDVPKR